MRQALLSKKLTPDRSINEPPKKGVNYVRMPDQVSDDTASAGHVGGSLTVEEAALFLKMHPATVLAKARAGEIPGA